MSLINKSDLFKYVDRTESLNETASVCEQENIPMLVEIPRQAKLFRVLMERKLGIDWEHSF